MIYLVRLLLAIILMVLLYYEINYFQILFIFKFLALGTIVLITLISQVPEELEIRFHNEKYKDILIQKDFILSFLYIVSLGIFLFPIIILIALYYLIEELIKPIFK